MKKIVFLSFLLLSGVVAFSQNLDNVREALSKNEIAKAKELIDKFFTNPKNEDKAEGWYLKGVVYNAVNKNETLRTSCEDCLKDAFEALVKYQKLDKKNIYMVVEQNASLFDIYNNYFDLGVAAFNAKDFDKSYYNFKGALTTQQYLFKKGLEYNGFKFSELDTSLVLNIATSAVLAKKEDDAVPYYQMMIDAGLSDEQYIVAYEFMAEYYKKKGDVPNFYKAIENGKRVYPKDEFWTAIEVELVRESSTKDEVFAKYDTLFTKNPNDFTIGYNYAVDVYNYIYANDDKNAGKDPKYKAMLKDVLSKTIALKSNGESNMLMARFLYNSSFDNSDAAKKIKGTKPADISSRKALNDAASADLTSCITYLESASKYYETLSTLKPLEKSNYRQSLSMLQEIYEIKKETAKAAAVGEKMKAIH